MLRLGYYVIFFHYVLIFQLRYCSIGFYADEDGKPWFLFCRILTPGRIVLETGPNYTGGVIVTGKRDGVGFRNQSLSIEKKQRLLNKEMVVKLVFLKILLPISLKALKPMGPRPVIRLLMRPPIHL